MHVITISNDDLRLILTGLALLGDESEDIGTSAGDRVSEDCMELRMRLPALRE